jgi:hypothetical protein
MNGERGDGPYTHGSSYANGPGMPSWLRLNWELRMVLEARTTIWDFH